MQEFKPASSTSAARAYHLVRELQQRFASGLERVGTKFGAGKNSGTETFATAQWQRDDGRHGGGEQRVGTDDVLFNRASINISQVHYDDAPEKPLGSANALSTIIHPKNPYAPSVHIHISWTEMKGGGGYWRVMADLNPSLVNDHSREMQAEFELAMRGAAPKYYDAAKIQGEKYFYIPALNRHRGVSHFYLEGFKTENADADVDFAKQFGEAVIDSYLSILVKSLEKTAEINASQQQEQLAYHTLYLFQVLTLDRGTTSGLMVHNQNDLGIMGSLPAFVDRDLLLSWKNLVPVPQDRLVEQLCSCLAPGKSPVNEKEKRALYS